MKRTARLASARHWLLRHEGKNVVRGYARWFGVDHLCAAKELELLGVAIDPAYVAQLECTARSKAISRKSAKEREAAKAEALARKLREDTDDVFVFIAGRTSAGFAYGLTLAAHRCHRGCGGGEYAY
ncbi:MAG: hypothetical protein GY711_17700 [bacterium]|nr:hypothetical protein [bacterium]